MNFFDYLNAINDTKVDLMKDDPLAVKEYKPFMINRGLSYFSDTVMQANEMNLYSDIPREWQFQFLLNTITRKKRFSKWHKGDAETKAIKLVMEYYGYSSEKAKQVADLFTKTQLDQIEKQISKGGK
jgi:hypothetical protein